MENWRIVLVCWLVFDFLIFIWATIDFMYYSPKIKGKVKHIKDALTEE